MMSDLRWLHAAYFYMLESLLESAILLLFVQAVLRWARLRSPVAVSRFLLLPLVIPVLVSPALHLLFPQLARLSLSVQIEQALPFLDVMRQASASRAPLLVAVFLSLFAFNVAQWLAIGLREALDGARTARTGCLHACATTLARLAGDFGVPSPRLALSERQPFSAYGFGWRHPTIILGREWLIRLDAQELEALFAHELAHFKRGDNWQALAAKICRDLMFFNPLAHYIYDRLVAAREEAADDLAWRVTRKPLALASCLLKFWQTRQPAVARAGGLSLAARPAGMERRIHRLIAGIGDERSDHNLDRIFIGLCVALTIIFSVI